MDVIRQGAVMIEVGDCIADGSVGNQSPGPRSEIREEVQGLGAAKELDGDDVFNISYCVPAS